MNTMLGTVPSEEDYKSETVDAGEMTEALLISERGPQNPEDGEEHNGSILNQDKV